MENVTCYIVGRLMVSTGFDMGRKDLQAVSDEQWN